MNLAQKSVLNPHAGVATHPSSTVSLTHSLLSIEYQYIINLATKTTQPQCHTCHSNIPNEAPARALTRLDDGDFVVPAFGIPQDLMLRTERTH